MSDCELSKHLSRQYACLTMYHIVSQNYQET